MNQRSKAHCVHALLSGVFLLASAPGCKSKTDKPVAKQEPTSSASTPPKDVYDAGVIPSDAAALILPAAPPIARTPLGLPRAPSPAHNPTTAEKVSLGELLFFDPRLSGGELACASCHEPARGYSSSQALSKTAAGQLNQRHTPSLWNLAYQEAFYWDGRATPMESQILGHWQGQLDGNPDERTAEIALLPVYQAHFNRTFAGEISRDRVAEALAAFVRNQLYGDSPWDRYEAGQGDAVSAEVIAGAKIFNQRAGCANCHAPPLYTDLRYHRLSALSNGDPGRAAVTRRPEDNGAFKTPSLRGVLHSAPYFHDGSAATLGDVLDRKEASGSPALTPEERAFLLLFLESMSPAPLRKPPPTPP